MLGKSEKTVLIHLSKLTSATGMTWNAMENGSIVVNFPAPVANQPGVQNRSCQLPSQEDLDSQHPVEPPTSYFPARIMGYITYNDDVDRLTIDENA